MKLRILNMTVVTLASFSIAFVVGTPASATGARVARGTLHPFAATFTDPSLAQYAELAGHAQMVRTADGKTIVSVHVTGLLANVFYPSHVHKSPCAAGDADGHYRFDPNGPADALNEIWMSFTSGNDGVGHGSATADRTAGVAAVSVVVHAPGGAKIGCADLA